MTLEEYLKGHSQQALASRIGVSQSAVSQWLRDGVSLARVRDVVEATGGEVTAHDLCPEIFPAGFVFPPLAQAVAG